MGSAQKGVPEATVTRLPIYRRTLVELASTGVKTVSSAKLADLSGVNAAKVRKDLSYLGSYGVRGVGYDVELLLHQIGLALGMDVDSPVVIVGMGNLGQALARYRGFATRGFPVVALVDASSERVGSVIEGLRVIEMAELGRLVDDFGIAVGIIATPAEAAQGVADALIDAGVGSILNFAPTVVSVPPGIPLRKVDLATELQILSYYQHLGVSDEEEPVVPADAAR